jgi:hypothetical protein
MDWQDQTNWPRDAPETVFLGRAVNRLGSVLFGEDWTGEEPGLRALSFLKIATDSRATNNFIARHLPQFGLKEYHGSMAPPPTGHDDHRPKFKFSEGELQEMRLFIERHNEAVPSAKQRFKKVQNAIADYAINKKLATSFRAFAGGDFHSMPANWWNTEQLEQRFASCSIDPNAPFEGGGGTAWIFVSGADLEVVSKLAVPKILQTMTQGNKCQEWLEEQFAAGIQGGKREFFKLAKKKFGVSWRHFQGIWLDATKKHPDRRRAGRKKAKTN